MSRYKKVVLRTGAQLWFPKEWNRVLLGAPEKVEYAYILLRDGIPLVLISSTEKNEEELEFISNFIPKF